MQMARPTRSSLCASVFAFTSTAGTCQRDSIHLNTPSAQQRPDLRSEVQRLESAVEKRNLRELAALMHPTGAMQLAPCPTRTTCKSQQDKMKTNPARALWSELAFAVAQLATSPAFDARLRLDLHQTTMPICCSPIPTGFGCPTMQPLRLSGMPRLRLSRPPKRRVVRLRCSGSPGHSKGQQCKTSRIRSGQHPPDHRSSRNPLSDRRETPRTQA